MEMCDIVCYCRAVDSELEKSGERVVGCNGPVGEDGKLTGKCLNWIHPHHMDSVAGTDSRTFNVQKVYICRECLGLGSRDGDGDGDGDGGKVRDMLMPANQIWTSI